MKAKKKKKKQFPTISLGKKLMQLASVEHPMFLTSEGIFPEVQQ